MPISNDDLENHKLEVETHKLEVETRKLELEANNLTVETRNDEVRSYSASVFWAMLAFGGMVIGVLVAVLAGYLLGHFTHVRTKTVAQRTITVTTPVRSSPTKPVAAGVGVAKSFEIPNADLFNTRDVASAINASNVSKLRLASIPPKNQPIYADTPVFSPDGSIEYAIDLSSNVAAVEVATRKVLWTHDYNIADEGPNGLNYTHGVIYGTTGTYAFALAAQTGKQLWRTPVIEKPGTANGQDVDSAPTVWEGKVFVATSGQVHAGLIFAFDAKTGKRLWTFNTDKDPADRTGKFTAAAPLPGSGGAWEPRRSRTERCTSVSATRTGHRTRRSRHRRPSSTTTARSR